MIIYNERRKKFKVDKNSILEIGDIKIGKNVTIQVKNKLIIGDGTCINDNCIIKGVDIKIGKDFWMDTYAEIGGGSCFTPFSKLEIGNFCHLGKFGFINTARSVKIGYNVGMGMNTRIYTHGVYLSALDGFPFSFGSITIGNNVWIPSAIIFPNVKIGQNVVIGVQSVVTKNLPSNCLAMGSPAKPIKINIYPRFLTREERENLFKDVVDETLMIMKADKKKIPPIKMNEQFTSIIFGDNTFHIMPKPYCSNVLDETGEYLKNQFRRYGVRFS